MKSTIRRDYIKKQIALGKVEARCNYKLSDDYSFDSAIDYGKTEWLPVKLSEPKNRTYSEPCIYFADYDFKFSTGMAWKNDDGTITFAPLASECYTLRII